MKHITLDGKNYSLKQAAVKIKALHQNQRYRNDILLTKNDHLKKVYFQLEAKDFLI